MRQTSLHRDEQEHIGHVEPNPASPQATPGPTDGRREALLSDRPESEDDGHRVADPVASLQRIADRSDAEHAEPSGAILGADCQEVLASEDGRRPIGHVIAHEPGEAPPPPRDPGRPSGRIAPYARVRADHRGHPIGHVIGRPAAATQPSVGAEDPHSVP